MCSVGDIVVVCDGGALYRGHRGAADAISLDSWVKDKWLEGSEVKYAILGIYMTPSAAIAGMQSLDTGFQYLVGSDGLEVVGHILDYEEEKQDE